MNNLLNIIRLVLTTLFGAYEFWTFKNKKSLKNKLIPIIITFVFSLALLLLQTFAGLGGQYVVFVFIVLAIELCIIGTMLVVLTELCITLFSPVRNLKKTLILAIVLIILAVVFYLGQKVF
jgi:hypothetical protein